GMESKQAVDRRVLSAPFLYTEPTSAKPVQALDGVALLRLCASDPANPLVWNEFLSRFSSRIRYFILRASQMQWARYRAGACEDRMGRRSDTEDLVQEVLVRLATNECLLLKRFRGETEDALQCYLSVVATSVVMDHYKYLRRERRLAQDTSLEAVEPEVLE